MGSSESSNDQTDNEILRNSPETAVITLTEQIHQLKALAISIRNTQPLDHPPQPLFEKWKKAKYKFSRWNKSRIWSSSLEVDALLDECNENTERVVEAFKDLLDKKSPQTHRRKFREPTTSAAARHTQRHPSEINLSGKLQTVACHTLTIAVALENFIHVINRAYAYIEGDKKKRKHGEGSDKYTQRVHTLKNNQTKIKHFIETTQTLIHHKSGLLVIDNHFIDPHDVRKKRNSEGSAHGSSPRSSDLESDAEAFLASHERTPQAKTKNNPPESILSQHLSTPATATLPMPSGESDDNGAGVIVDPTKGKTMLAVTLNSPMSPNSMDDSAPTAADLLRNGPPTPTEDGSTRAVLREVRASNLRKKNFPEHPPENNKRNWWWGLGIAFGAALITVGVLALPSVSIITLPMALTEVASFWLAVGGIALGGLLTVTSIFGVYQSNATESKHVHWIDDVPSNSQTKIRAGVNALESNRALASIRIISPTPSVESEKSDITLEPPSYEEVAASPMALAMR